MSDELKPFDAAMFDRLWRHCMPVPESGCWLWTASLNGGGYGAVSVNGKHKLAHRMMYVLFNGEAPEGFDICHKCDVRSCCNPAHLFSGTRLDNMRDMVAKGRQSRGAQNGATKLTAEKVLMARKLHSEGVGQKRLAKMFAVCKKTMQQALKGENWSYV